MTPILNTRRVYGAVVGLGLFAIASRNVTDPDVWWHLRTGQLILQNHAVFHADPYSVTKLGQPWVNHEWLSDVLIYALYRFAGWAGLIAAFAVLTSAAFMLVWLRCGGRPVISSAITVWSAIASAPAWGVRPQTVSLFLASVFLLLLDWSKERPNLLWWMLPLVTVWVNLHGEFALGIGLILLFLVGELLDAALGFENWETVSPRVQKLSLLCIGCFAVVPFNPYGARMYLYPFQTVHARAIQMYISEWGSPNFHQEMYLPALSLLLATLVGAALSPLRLRPRDLLLLSVMAWAGLHSSRHLPIYALVAAPVLSRLVDAWFEKNRPDFGAELSQNSHASRRQWLNGFVLVFFLMLATLKVRSVLRNQPQSEGDFFPSDAVSFLHEHKLPAPIFNSYNWGGYLIWRLYPEYRVYIDGRSDLYGDAFMDQFAGVYQLSNPAWNTVLGQWRIQTVILPTDAPLVAALRLTPGWAQVYEGSQTVILCNTQQSRNQQHRSSGGFPSE